MNQANKPRRLRARTLLKGLAALVVLAWFSRYTYVRISTPPSSPAISYADLAERFGPTLRAGVTEQLIDAIDSLPDLPMFNEVPPPGMQWNFASGGPPLVDPTEVNAGEWDPDARPHLRAAIAYLTYPETTAALKQVRGCRDRNWQRSLSFLPGGSVPGVEYSDVRQMAKTLVARARYRHAELADLEGAWDDLKTVLLLGEHGPRALLLDGLVFSATQAIALQEIRHMAMERRPGSALAVDMEQTLGELTSYADEWAEMMKHETEFSRRFRDALFTDDGRGNGWLVLSEWDSLSSYFVAGGTPPRDRNRVWNVASVFFNDRKTVEAKAEKNHRRIVELAELPYPEACSALLKMERESGAFDFMDGPQLAAFSGATRPGAEFRSFQLMLMATAARDATRIMVVLSRHHEVYGRYPAELADLVPEFFSELPTDPFCGRPFVYRLQSDDAFVLYSCGDDAKDDGGVSRTELLRRGQDPSQGWDPVYSEARRDPIEEITLEPVTPESDPSETEPEEDAQDEPEESL